MISNAGGSMAIAAANAALKMIREHSCNKSIGVMVGGPIFLKHPGSRCASKRTLLDLSVSRAQSWRGCVLAAT
jgi:hypothetical protein